MKNLTDVLITVLFGIMILICIINIVFCKYFCIILNHNHAAKADDITFHQLGSVNLRPIMRIILLIHFICWRKTHKSWAYFKAHTVDQQNKLCLCYNLFQAVTLLLGYSYRGYFDANFILIQSFSVPIVQFIALLKIGCDHLNKSLYFLWYSIGWTH